MSFTHITETKVVPAFESSDVLWFGMDLGCTVTLREGHEGCRGLPALSKSF